MTIMELTNNLWYAQPVAVIKSESIRNKVPSEDDAIMYGRNYNLRSILYKEINKMPVVSYGVIDNVFVIVVK